MPYYNGQTVVITPTLAGISTDQVQDVRNWNVYKTVNSVEAFVEEITITPVFPAEEGEVLFVFEYTYIVLETLGDVVSFRFEPSGTEYDLSDASLGEGNGLDWSYNLGTISEGPAMSLPSGTEGYLEIVIDRTLIPSAMSNFPYQIDLSANLAADSNFKSKITTAENIAIYDVLNDVTLPRMIKLDLDNNILLVRFDGTTITTNDRSFFVCVGSGVSDSDDTNAYVNSNYTDLWSGDYVDGTTATNIIGTIDGVMTSIDNNTGKFGKAFDYADAGDVIDLSAPLIGTGNVSIEFLIYKRTDGIESANARIMDNGEFEIYLATETIAVKSGASSSIATTVASALPNTAWNHVIITRQTDGTTAIYVNGVDKTNASSSATNVASANNMKIGNFYATNIRTPDGLLDEFGIMSDIKDINFALTRSNMFLDSGFYTVNAFVEIPEDGYGSNYDYGESPKYKDEDAGATGIPIITTPAINDSIMISV